MVVELNFAKKIFTIKIIKINNINNEEIIKILYDNNKLDSNWSVEYTISNNQLLIYEEPEEGNPTSVYEIKELTKNKLVLLYKKVDDNDGYKAEITTTFKKI